jgi:hypothetical protein
MSEQRDRISSTMNTGMIGCPFFIAHGKTEIVCEGLIDGTKLYCSFNDAEDKKWHQYNYCEKNYQRCEIYCSIKHWKWPEEE